jgi:hypothetical protein
VPAARGIGIGVGLLWLFVSWIVLVVLIVMMLVAWVVLQYAHARRQWGVAELVRLGLPARRPVAVVLLALALQRLSRGPTYWPSRLAYRLLGTVAFEQRQELEGNIALWLPSRTRQSRNARIHRSARYGRSFSRAGNYACCSSSA